jgi:hypothetical protein
MKDAIKVMERLVKVFDAELLKTRRRRLPLGSASQRLIKQHKK